MQTADWQKAHSQFFLRGGAIQRGDRPDEAGGASLGGGGRGGVALVVESELRARLQLGAHFKGLSVTESTRGGDQGHAPPENFKM